jgi:hypothetical protein
VTITDTQIMPGLTTDLILTMTAERAHELTRLLQEDCSTLTEHVTEAYLGRVWEFEGYDTWEDYCAGEKIHVPREYIPELHEAGMSSRAIAPVAGVSHMTAARDLAGVTNVTPELEPEADEAEPERVTGRDGKSYPKSRAVPAEPTQPARGQRTVGRALAPSEAFASAHHRLGR